jgi:hypothetical protein
MVIFELWWEADFSFIFNFRLQKQGWGCKWKFFNCIFSLSYMILHKKSLLQNKEHRIFMFQGIVSDFTRNRWSKDQKNWKGCK